MKEEKERKRIKKKERDYHSYPEGLRNFVKEFEKEYKEEKYGH